VSQQIEQTRTQLNESGRQLSAAAVAVEQAQLELDAARARLATTREELAAATARDRAVAAKLKRTQAQLAAAKAAVVAAQRRLKAQLHRAGDLVRDQYQQQTNLLSVALLVEGDSMADLQTRLQWSTAMFDTASAEIDRLTVLQRQLTAKRARVAELEREVAADRQAAARNLARKRTLEQQATAQEADVATSLTQREAAQQAAASAVAADKQRYAELTREREAVERRITARIAAAQAAAKRRAAAERAAAKARKEARRAEAAAREARDDAAAARRAAKARKEARRAEQKADRVQQREGEAPTRKSRPDRPRADEKAASHGFAYPVSGPITSAFGSRFHPVLRYWKLHDGTDFGAGCGAPIRAPYEGRVTERYWNAGYGNRLLLEHGTIDGRYVTTSYNHAIRYTVQVGQRVSKGELIGYVGSTGYSTGCHLHLMVWLDGDLVNPMTWF